jgi:hypothetical protein
MFLFALMQKPVDLSLLWVYDLRREENTEFVLPLLNCIGAFPLTEILIWKVETVFLPSKSSYFVFLLMALYSGRVFF